jgi:hypothetical protein
MWKIWSCQGKQRRVGGQNTSWLMMLQKQKYNKYGFTNKETQNIN